MYKILTAIVVTILLFSCGGEQKKSSPKVEEPKEAAKTQEAPKEEMKKETSDQTNENSDDNVIEIEGNDQMKFNETELYAEAGKETKLVLKHVGKMDVKVMGHNWVLLKKGVDVAKFAEAANKAQDKGYIPNDGADVIAYTSVIGGGEQTEVTFTAPEAGEYVFICSFPGHYSMMKGTLFVE